MSARPTLRQLQVLQVLTANPDASLRDIGDALGVSRISIHQICRRLLAGGWIDQERAITESGRAALSTAVADFSAALHPSPAA